MSSSPLKRKRNDTEDNLMYIRNEILFQLESLGAKKQYIDEFQNNFMLSHIHIPSMSVNKKKWFHIFGGCINHKYPPWISLTYNSNFWEKVLEEFEDDIINNVTHVTKDTFKKFSIFQNVVLNIDDEIKNMKICFMVPLPLLVFNPKLHVYNYVEKVTRVRMYYNPLDIKWKKSGMEERFAKLQELNSCITFACLKNSLKGKKIDCESPILYLEMNPVHIGVLFCVLFANATRTAGAVCDVSAEKMNIDYIFGYLNGCRYVALNNEKEKEKIRSNMKTKLMTQAFLEGKRSYKALEDSMNFISEFPEIKFPEWKRLSLETGNVKSFSVNSNFFMFAQTSKQEGEFICAQFIHDLIKNDMKEEKSISIEINNKLLQITQTEAIRLEMYHKKCLAKEYVPSVHTISPLDGDPDNLLKCPLLISQIIGKIPLF
jgi:hypothetical protein